MIETHANRIEKEIQIFSNLGKLFSSLAEKKAWPGFDIGLAKDEYNAFLDLIENVRIYNQWFTPDNVRKSLETWSYCLNEKSLKEWTDKYNFDKDKVENVALILAGNIPLVGMHDLLSVLFSGNRALVKLSSDDEKLLLKIIEVLIHWDPTKKDAIEIVNGKLKNFDRVIATGSNNTSRYFDYYFGKVPNIIRKNRSSLAILSGDESKEDLKRLGEDIFSYFGLGCRNVSKIYIPEDYKLDTFFQGIYDYSDVVNHNKYGNNYDYNKAIWLLNEDKILDNGFVLLKESKDFSAPTGSIYFERYSDYAKLLSELESKEEEIQCIVSKNHLDFGSSQTPSLLDYADGIDTMEFLLKN